jgi:hypothetical protein
MFEIQNPLLARNGVIAIVACVLLGVGFAALGPGIEDPRGSGSHRFSGVTSTHKTPLCRSGDKNGTW